MAVNMEGSQTHFYDEIEPFCRWRRTEDIDILELHLPSGLKKEHLKIQINNSGVLTITGGCPVDQTKTIRFMKETKVAKDCKRNEIRAKFSKGVLYVTMPKTIPIAAGLSVSLKGATPQHQTPKTDEGMRNVANCSSEFYSKFGSLKQRLWRKTVVEGVAAVVVVAAAVLGVVKAYQYFMASPV
ncbi:unnamed protein product [Arabidopsis thaliana]|uniref:HSP20-like chaperones superfamily protein n=4 Tax=Arabidopsis TaxID=3701 RepID=F4HWW7_ARATH|nr:HSP20-like chaperones superfamily protein [Arabidopsis thaliana]KAG7649610.1 Alpha crystallin/Hsp20 domain [Arabidopsis thaliana x Arabidopsis arenosa]KAG7657477.1 Alpha crystallin/Hsp20 domain [Arabidopsis suecica]AEE33099.1 HSP20-like chaperones superfamily protein [Arabidopsis thaliana]OAP16647.1 hypothetical protein AXX17_AT1G48880 [Arabidopsis thaliana]CAA0294444.1 unnamed protein product [Arabidopsis thaliana]|eukprot:NP_175842.4 HSP20-like chaperones superfamily protein [Arabidopsis thaliana]